jgi:hypothetical protein
MKGCRERYEHKHCGGGGTEATRELNRAKFCGEKDKPCYTNISGCHGATKQIAAAAAATVVSEVIGDDD